MIFVAGGPTPGGQRAPKEVTLAFLSFHIRNSSARSSSLQYSLKDVWHGVLCVSELWLCTHCLEMCHVGPAIKHNGCMRVLGFKIKAEKTPKPVNERMKLVGHVRRGSLQRKNSTIRNNKIAYGDSGHATKETSGCWISSARERRGLRRNRHCCRSFIPWKTIVHAAAT